jgi:L-amino acid N-acyltransferase YncA
MIVNDMELSVSRANVAIRDASAADLDGILTIFNQVVTQTTAIYDEHPSTLEERSVWFESRRAAGFPILVAELDEAVIGFASYGDWRARWGYRYTVEHSVHVEAQHRGHGTGRALVEALLIRARAAGMHIMIGGIDAANLGSIRFHQRLGFVEAGRYREVAHKFGRWLDLVSMQYFLDDPGSQRC